MKSVDQCSETELALVLRDFFPCMVFIPKKSGGNLAVKNYVIKKNNKWTLNIAAMTKSNEKRFSSLFPDDISSWDEAKARKIFGCADVIKFFINEDNNRFIAESVKSNKEISCLIDNEIPEHFFNKLKETDKNYETKPIWEDWNFTGMIQHKLRRDPPNIYEAFYYYARRDYTILKLALNNLNSENISKTNMSVSKLLRDGKQILDKEILELFPKLINLSVEYQIAFFELLQEILEGTPTGQSRYSPTEKEVLLKQIKSRSFSLKNSNLDVNHADSFNQTERKTINNHIAKVSSYIKDESDKKELNKLKLEGTYREKINFLHKIVFSSNIQEHYSRRELDMIHGLFLKQYFSISLDNQLNDGEDDAAFTGHETIKSNDYLQPDENLIWKSFFKDVFKHEFDEKTLEIFLECIPTHFEQFPLDIDQNGIYSMSRYSKQKLFSTFCSVANIPEDNALWAQFSVLLKQVIDNINRSLQ